MRLKGVRGDSWRILKVETDNLSGMPSIIARRIPSLPLTKNKRQYLDWDAGLPLHKFLALLCRDEESYSQTAEILRSRTDQWSGQQEAEIISEGGDESENDSVAEWVKKFRL